jgi:hypothetical protein
MHLAHGKKRHNTGWVFSNKYLKIISEELKNEGNRVMEKQQKMEPRVW